MKILESKVFEKNLDLGLLILRLAVGVLMFLHGFAKLQHGIDPIQQMVEAQGLPGFFAYGVYIGEVIAPIFIILGFGTRLAAIAFVINCLVAGSMAHMGDLFSLNSVGGWAVELLGLYMFAALALVFTGGGKYALSHKYIWD